MKKDNTITPELLAKESCYICGQKVGVFQWTDAIGLAHPWCATEKSWSFKTKG